MLRAYGLRIAVFAVAGLLIGVAMTLLMHPKYEAIMQVLVDQSPPQNSRMMTNAEESVRDLLDAPRARTVATQVEQLTGFGVLSRAVQAVYAKRNRPVGSIPELDLMELQRSISVEAANTSDLITLTVRLPDPDLARDVANEIYLAYDAQNQEASKEVGSRALVFLESQTNQIRSQLNSVDGQIEALKKQYGTPAVDSQVTAEIQTLRNLDEQLQQARIEYAAATADASTLRDRLQQIAPTIRSSESVGINGNYQRLEAALADANTEKAQLLTQWQAGSPAIKAVDDKIRTLSDALKKTQPQISSGSQTSTNPLYTSLSAEVAQAEARAAAAREKIAAASVAVEGKKLTLVSMPEVQRKMQDLARQQDSLTRTYLQYKDTLDSLKVAQRGRTTQSTLVSPAFVNPKPVSPNTTLNLMVGLIAGILLGVLSAFGSESKKSPIRTLTHLNRLSLEPSFRTIPELPQAKPSLAKMPDDAYVALLANFVRSNRRPYRLGVMGVDPYSGASTTAAALAVASALDDRPTLLVDTAERNGSADRLETNERLLTLKAVEDSPLSDHRKVDEIRALEQDRQLCVFDLQPYKGVGNPLLFAGALDECILLVRAGQTRSVDFLQAQQMLIDAGVPQVTVVLSRTKNLEDDFSFLDPETPALEAR